MIERAPSAEPATAAERTPAPGASTRRSGGRAARRPATSDSPRTMPQKEPAVPSAAPSDRVETSELAAATPPPDERRTSERPTETVTPTDTVPPNAPPPPTDGPSAVERSPAVTAPPENAVPSVDRPRNAAAAVSRPACPDPAAMIGGGSAADGRSRSQQVADCVGGWLKGEAKEFRDGVKREVDEFRTGVDRVGRGLQQWLGSKLRRAE